MDQKRKGIILSYTTILFNTVFSIFFTPYLISTLGKSEYGLYQLINSFAGYLIILNFGVGVAIARFVAKYRAENDQKGQENFLVTAGIVTFILFITTIVIGSVFFGAIDILFFESLSSNELILAKRLYILMVVNLSLQIVSHAISGVIIGYERFDISNLNKLLRILFKYLILYFLLKTGKGALTIVIVDLFLTILFILIEGFYSFTVLHIKIKFHYWDYKLIITLASFSVAMLIQTVLNQVNQNLDRVLLGSYINTDIVTLYSISLVFYTTFSSLTGVVGGVFLPQATRMIYEGANSEKLTQLVIKPGRIQFILGGAIVCGFILFGRNFIIIWVGMEFQGAYLPAVILMTSSLIPLVQSVATSIVDAKMKRFGLSMISLIMVIVNVTCSIILINKIGYLGAAYGTSISVVLGNVILSNIYYYKIIRLNVITMLKEIFRGILPSLMIATILSLPVSIFMNDSLSGFIIKSIYFIIVYILMLFKYGFNSWEKDSLMRLIKKAF